MPGRRKNAKPDVHLSERKHTTDGSRMSSQFDNEEPGALNHSAPCEETSSNQCERRLTEHSTVGPKIRVQSEFSSPTFVNFDGPVSVSHDYYSPGALNPKCGLSADTKEIVEIYPAVRESSMPLGRGAISEPVSFGKEPSKLAGSPDIDGIKCSDELLQEEIEIKMEELKLRRMQLELVKRRERQRQVTSCDSSYRDHELPKEQVRTSIFTQRCLGSTDDNMYRPGGSVRVSSGSNCLPKIEIQPFDGSVRSFWSFMRSFETTLGCKMSDGAEKLSYLLYYCRGPAREAIENCVLLDPEFGYSEALRILKSQFGRPHVVMQTLMRELLDGPLLVTGDLEGLRSLARRMRGCLITLTQMDRLAELNCSSNLVRIVERLPREERYKWAEKADAVINEGREPSFEELLDFIDSRVSIASNMYGVVASSAPEKYARQFTKQTDLGRRVLATYSSGIAECLFCQGQHSLEICDDFRNATQPEKLAFLRKNKRCFLCLRPNHMAKDCRVSTRCAIENCGGRHHTIMHARTVRKLPTVEAEESTSHCGAVASRSKGARLGFVPVKLVCNSKTVLTYALIDNGSDVTLIDDVVSQALGVSGRPHTLTVRTLHGTKIVPAKEVVLEIHSLNGESMVPVDLAYVVENLPVTHVDKSAVVGVENWEHLKGVQCEVLQDDRVGILIGCNVPEAHWVLEQRVGDRKDPYAIRSVFGWCIRGPSSLSVKHERCVNCIGIEEASLTESIRKLFELEFVETEYAEGKAPSIEDAQALEIVKSSVTYSDGHYEIGLPWRSGKEKLPSNLVMAERRVQSLRRRLNKDSVLREKYIETISRHINKGYISKVTQGEGPCLNRWFLPHHPVLNPNKPGKVRVVFDCAALYDGISLNQALLQGPDMTSSLVGVLLRFRRYAVAVCADIEEMFLQVRVPVADRKALSLLWWTNADLTGRPEVFEMSVHPFGATSSPFCANFALRQTAADNHTNYSLLAVKAVEENFYVDDCLLSVESVPQAKQIVDELCSMLRAGGFNLTKWVSNHPEVVSHLPSNSRDCKYMNMDFELPEPQRTLGIMWNIKSDCFYFRLQLPKTLPTRRGILKCVASLYDPMGLVAPMLLPARKLLQDLCYRDLGWDVPVEEHDRAAWEGWLSNIRTIESVEVPRCISPGISNTNMIDLHMFSDASEIGYGSVAYLRLSWADGTVKCGFLIGKSRVASRKMVSIPRLELVSAVLSARLMNLILGELRVRVHRTLLWTDSAVVLRYIHNTSTRFATFVANRVRTILDVTSPAQWRHVPSASNPADVASRGAHAAQSKEMGLWLRGPEFLRLPESDWPPLVQVAPLTAEDPEVKCLSTFLSNAPNNLILDKLITRYDSWIRALRAVAWLLRFIQYFKVLKTGRCTETVRCGPLRVAELDAACCSIIRLVQDKWFHDVLVARKGGSSTKTCKSSRLNRLHFVKINDIICLQGRVTPALTDVSENLAILPSRDAVTELIVKHYHDLEGHAGASHVLACVRRRFWILKGMASVRRVINKCYTCRMQRAKPCEQIMAPLPQCRVTVGFYPFKYTGVDYFGPFRVRVGRSNPKRYGCLFTCLQTRAIHLEVAHSMSTDSFLMALIRFVDRRGPPDAMYSDNGSNFVGADCELKGKLRALDQQKIGAKLLCRRIDWHFNPPDASHRGGSWERMIRTVRRLLAAVTQEQIMGEEALLTYMIEVERIVNDRPLVPVYDDPQKPKILRPSDLLLLRPSVGLSKDEVTMSERYTKAWRQAQHLASVFWKRWVREYLPSLQVCHKWSQSHRDLKVGDLVLLIGGQRHVGSWPKGVVSEVKTGVDHRVREVYVRTDSGILRRDIRSLCLLEACE